MKKSAKMLLLLCVLALLTGAYLLLPRLFAEEEPDDSIRLSDRSGSDLTALSWTWQGESCTLTQQDGRWSVAADPDFPVDQDRAVRMAEAAAVLKSSRELGDADRTQYGLDKPFLTVSASFAGGDVLELAFGDVSAITGEYYAEYAGRVYLLDSAVPDAFSLHRLSLLSLTAGLPALSAPQRLSLTGGGRELTVEKHEEGGLWYSDQYQWFYPAGNRLHAADTDTVSGLLSVLREPGYTSAVLYDADDAALESCGLGETALRLSAADALEGEYSLLVGNETDDGFYARADGSRTVLLLPADKARTLMSLDENALCPDEVCRIPLNEVSELTISVDGRSVTAAVSDEAVTAAGAESGEGEGDTEERVFVFRTDSGELDGTALTLALSDIFMLRADRTDGDGTKAGRELFSVCYRQAGREDLTLTLYAYDAEHCLAAFNGESRLLCGREKTEEIRELLAEIIVGYN